MNSNHDVPIFVICRDRLRALKALVSWLTDAGHDNIVLLDNDSEYPALLEYLEASPHSVVRLGANLGHRSPWLSGAVGRLRPGQPYVVTDCDVVPDESCPQDAVGRLRSLLLRYPAYAKAGLGLRLDDLPDTPRSTLIRNWESQFWLRAVERGVYHANVDTTFAIYRGPDYVVSPALRTAAPYVARHIPWYQQDDDDETEFYRRRADRTMNWDRSVLPSELMLSGPVRMSPIERMRWALHRRFRLQRSYAAGDARTPY